MGLKKCPECGKLINSKEVDCPKCGAFVYNSKDNHIEKYCDDHTGNTTFKNNDCSHTSYSKEQSYTPAKPYKNITYGSKTTYGQSQANSTKVLSILAIVFGIFGFMGNPIFSLIGLKFAKQVIKQNPEDPGVTAPARIAKVLCIISIIFFILIFVFGIGAAMLAEIADLSQFF